MTPDEKQHFNRDNPAGVLHVTVTHQGEEVGTFHATGFSVYETDQHRYEVRI